jgi:hypothetical protein
VQDVEDHDLRSRVRENEEEEEEVEENILDD